MIRFLLLLLLVGCGPEEDMARVAPRVAGAVITSKNQRRILDQRTVALQEAAYQPEAYVRPATLDAADAAQSSAFLDGGSGGYMVSRVKRVPQAGSYSHIDIRPSVFNMTAEYVVVLCRYDDAVGLSVNEVARGTLRLALSSPNVFESIPLQRLIKVAPEDKFAIAVRIIPLDTSLPGAKFAEVIGFGGASAPALLWDAGLANDAPVSFQLPSDWDGQPAEFVSPIDFVPYAALSTGRAIERWY
jgi:hypothetical protein